MEQLDNSWFWVVHGCELVEQGVAGQQEEVGKRRSWVVAQEETKARAEEAMMSNCFGSTSHVLEL